VANVYRRGRKDVHRAIVSGDPDDPMRPNGCNLDGGGEWGPVLPPGPQCPVCFAALREQRSSGRGKPALVGTAAALTLATLVLASSFGEPVNFFPVPTNSVGPAFSALPRVTPEPTRVPLTPSTAPALTPLPTFVLPTFGPLPTYPPVPTYPPLPTWPPLPTFALPPLPDPTPKPCVHPGIHVGVDACRWPHQ